MSLCFLNFIKLIKNKILVRILNIKLGSANPGIACISVFGSVRRNTWPLSEQLQNLNHHSSSESSSLIAMAAALECWSRRATTTVDEDHAVLMQPPEQDPTIPQPRDSSSSSIVHKKLQKLTRNVSEAIASLKNSLNSSSTVSVESSKPDAPRSLVWTTVLRNLTHLYPGSQLPEKLVCNIRKHYDSLPLRF